MSDYFSSCLEDRACCECSWLSGGLYVLPACDVQVSVTPVPCTTGGKGLWLLLKVHRLSPRGWKELQRSLMQDVLRYKANFCTYKGHCSCVAFQECGVQALLLRTEFLHSRAFEMPSRTSFTVYMAEGTICENCTHNISDKWSNEPDVATKSQY